MKINLDYTGILGEEEYGVNPRARINCGKVAETCFKVKFPVTAAQDKIFEDL